MNKMPNWTKKDYEKITGQKLPKLKKAVPIPVEDPKAIQFIKNHLSLMGYPYVCEYRFHDKRKFRFDIALPELKLAIEYEGLMSQKSGHTTVGGYTKDCEKYNLSQLNGWIVLRYTVLNYKDFVVDFGKILK